jgi:hypothetical protein
VSMRVCSALVLAGVMACSASGVRAQTAMPLQGPWFSFHQGMRDYELESNDAGSSADASSIQTGPPSVNPASPTWLDRAGFPRLAVAVSHPIDDVDRGAAYTLNLDLLAPWIDASHGALEDVQPGGRPRSRLGGSFTLGGPTQVADGFATTARRPSVADHFTAEVKLRLLDGHPSGESALGKGTTAPTEPTPALAFSMSADHYATGFGLDLFTATLIAEISQPLNLTSNVGYRVEEEVREGRNDELKIAVGSSLRLLPGFPPGPVDATLSAGGLIRNHRRENVRLANAVVDFPLARSLKLTASMTCSNHPERTGEGLVRGCLGLSYVLSRTQPPRSAR